VCVLGEERHADVVQSYGLAFIGMPGCLRDTLSRRAAGAQVPLGGDSKQLASCSRVDMSACLSPLLAGWVDAATAAFEQFQPQFAVLSEFFALCASALVEAQQCPFAIVHTTHPNVPPCKELGPLPSYNDAWEKPGAGNTSGPFGGLVFDMASKKAWDRWWGPLAAEKRVSLGAPPLSDSLACGPCDLYRRDLSPNVFLFSQALVPMPADWSEGHNTICGWPRLAPPDALSEYRPEGQLDDFCSLAGPKPVLCDLGSALPEYRGDAGQLLYAVTSSILSAAGEGGRVIIVTRGVSLSSGGGDGGGGGNTDTDADADALVANPSCLFVEQPIPFQWILQRVETIVHSGGCGTVHAIAAAGLPSVAIPLGAVAEFWAGRLAWAGSAPSPLKVDKVVKECTGQGSCRAALACTLSSSGDGSTQTFRASAAALREQMVREGGSVTASRAVEQAIANPRTFAADGKGKATVDYTVDGTIVDFAVSFDGTVQAVKEGDKKPHTAYRLLVTSANGSVAAVDKRYSDFVKFHKDLKALLPKIQLPFSLPGKFHMPGGNMEARFVSRRQEALHFYIAGVLNHRDVRSRAEVDSLIRLFFSQAPIF
jgi:hypothetical protein